MDNLHKSVPITFREGNKQHLVEWTKEFSNIESLRNYMRVKMIQNISLRVFVRPMDKMITLKSYIQPADLTMDNYKWLLDSESSGEKFIVVNYRRS